MNSITLKTRTHQLEEFLFWLYKICEGKPGSIAFNVLSDWISERDQEFDAKDTIPFSQELAQAGFVQILTVGSVDLLPSGIYTIEELMENRRAEKEKTVNFGSHIPTSDEVQKFLTAACVEVDFDLEKEFNGTSIGESLNFSTEKIRLCMQRAEREVYICESNVYTTSDTTWLITTKTLSLIMGQIDKRDGAITLHADNSTKTDNRTTVTVGGNMIGSNIAQNSAGAAQTLTFTAGQKLDFQNFVDLARTNIDDLGLSDADRTELSNSLDIIEGTLADGAIAEPEVIKKELSIAQRVIEGAAGSAAGSALVEHLPALWTYIEPFI